MNEDELILMDVDKSLVWNYVHRVENELLISNKYQAITMNNLLPRSYKEVVMTLAKACDHSRVALLIDDAESYVAFMLLVEENYVPFLLEGLDDIVTPVPAVYKVFVDEALSKCSSGDGALEEFITYTVIPDLNDDFESWVHFKCDS